MSPPKIKDPRGGHVRFYWDILDSNAWRCLSAADQRAYVSMRRALLSFNNGDISFPFTTAKQFGISNESTLAKSLRALVAVGLIRITRSGGCKRGGQREVTLYRFTDEEVFSQPKKFVEACRPTNEWKAVTTLAMGRALITQAEADARQAWAKEVARRAQAQAEREGLKK